MTHLIEHKVELTESEPVKRKPYPIPYKMQEVIDNEIEDMLAMGIIERSEAPYASPLVLVKKPDGSYRVCVNFKDFVMDMYSCRPMGASVARLIILVSGARSRSWN